jgi:hypothetical protein
LSVGRLQESLQKTLNAYPQWASQLHFADYNPDGDHTQRFNRIILPFGGQTVSLEELFPEVPKLALYNDNKYEFDGLPGMIIQLPGCGRQNGSCIGRRTGHAICLESIGIY